MRMRRYEILLPLKYDDGSDVEEEKFLVSIVSDIFKCGEFIPYHMDTIRLAQAAGFKLKHIQVVMDHWKQKFIYGPPTRLFPYFHHHYALVFQK